MSSSISSPPKPIAIIMVPLPAQGHLNPLLLLSSLIASPLIHVHYISSHSHIRQALLRLPFPPPSSPHLHFHPLPFPSPPPPPPPPSPPSIKFPSHLQPSFDSSSSHLLPHLSSLLLSLSPSHRRLILLHDSSMSFASSPPSAPPHDSLAFHSSSAISNLFFLGLYPLPRANVPSCFSPDFLAWLARHNPLPSLTKARVFNTSPTIERDFLHRLSSHPAWQGRRIFSLGPLNPVLGNSRRSEELCVKWLDGKGLDSVVYVSFGTTASMSRAQLREIAAGLEACGQMFVWVCRQADRCDIFQPGDVGEEADEEFAAWEQRVKEKGIVVRGWAPQLEILAHPSTGGFLSHCGWNSCMEAMSNGVPILAWPIHSDQPANTVLVTEILRAGLVVKEWSEKEEVVTAAEVKEAVVRLMEGDEGREVRKNAREIGENLRAAVADGGSSKEDLDEFLNYICRP